MKARIYLWGQDGEMFLEEVVDHKMAVTVVNIRSWFNREGSVCGTREFMRLRMLSPKCIICKLKM